MTDLTYFVSRELLFLLILSALGSGPATFLSVRFSPLARAAMAPALGMCVGTAIFTCTLWFFPANKTFWLVPALAILSLAAAAHRSWSAIRPIRSKNSARLLVGVLEIVLVFLLVSAPTVYTFEQNRSVGPVTYLAPDSGAYTLTIDGMVHESLRTAAASKPGTSHDLSQAYLAQYINGFQEIDIDPFEANIDAFTGIGATGTQSPFMLAALVSGALGAFAATLYFLRRRSWVAVFAATLFGGPFFLQLFFDGSEGAICGLAVLLPLAVVGLDAIAETTVANAILLALLAAGLMALYPLFVAPVALVACVVLVSLIYRRIRGPGLDQRWLRRGITFCVATVLVASVMDPVVLLRDLRYWRSANGISGANLPRYDLAASVLPGWLFQSREFYALGFTGNSAVTDVFLSVLLPVIGAVIIVIGLRRHRSAWIPLFFVCASGALAIYEYGHTRTAGYNCSYCEDRSLLPVTVALILLLALGIAALASSASLFKRTAGACVALVFLVALGISLERERVAFEQQSQFLSPSVGLVLQHLPRGGAVIELEGFDEALQNPVASFMFAYARADEADWNHVSVPADYNENTSLMYFGGLGDARPGLPNPEFHPRYRYVLTRIAGVSSDRRVLFREGAVALETRARPLEVLVDYGFSVAPLTSDSAGIPFEDVWANEPIQLIVTGVASKHTYVGLWFDLPPSTPALHVTAPHLLELRRDGQGLAVCVQTTGSTESRTADLTLPPGANERLVAVSASTHACPSRPSSLRTS